MTEAFPYIAFFVSVALLLCIVWVGFRIADAEIERERKDNDE